MVTQQQKPTLVVYGATSFTAQQLLEYLDGDHPDKSSFTLILSGRNQGRLEKIARKLQGSYEIVVCDLNDEDQVERLVGRASVVLNFAGPYRVHNAEALIRQCARQGIHYVDLTGESHWLAKDIIPRYDFLASKTGACIVPSCGFDSVPSDLTLYHALRHLQASHGPQAGFAESTSFFRTPGASVSGGTVQTMYSEVEIKDRNVSEYCLTDEVGPESPFKFVHSLTIPSLHRRFIGSFFVMWPYNRCVIRRSAWLSRMAPSTLSYSGNKVTSDDAGNHRDNNNNEDPQPEPVHGKGMIYGEALQTTSVIKAFVISSVLFAFAGLFFSSKIFRGLLSYVLPKAGEGPSREQMEKCSYTVTNISVSNTAPPVQIMTTFKGQGEPGYLNTAFIIAEAALALTLPPPEGTSLPLQGRTGGVLTPSIAMGMVLVERLRRSGKVQIHSETLGETMAPKQKSV